MIEMQVLGVALRLDTNDPELPRPLFVNGGASVVRFIEGRLKSGEAYGMFGHPIDVKGVSANDLYHALTQLGFEVDFTKGGTSIPRALEEGYES